MAVIYYAGIDTADLSDGFAVVVGGAAGSGTATVTAGTYCAGAEDMSLISLAPVSNGYTPFADAVATALQTVNVAFTCSWSDATLAYTIACGGTSFTLTFSGNAGLNLSRALGMAVSISSTTTTSSTVRPYYVIQSEIDARSLVSDVYEAEDNVEEAVTDGGSAYGVDRDTEELRSDWVQAMEPIEAVMTRRLAAAVPWTWQDFFAHLRMSKPFVVNDNGSKTAHQLRAEGASFSLAVRERVVQEWDGIWNIRIMTRDLGIDL